MTNQVVGKNKMVVNIALLAALISLCFLYFPLLNHWWGWDDFFALVNIQKYQAFEYFTNPEFYDGNKANYTPFWFLTYEALFWVFGLEPGCFFAVQIVLIFSVFGSTMALLRLWVEPMWSVVGATLVCLSGPVMTDVYQLQCIHYLQGLLYVILAFYFFVIALRRNQLKYACLGATFYLLSCLCKEIYVPLVIVLLMYPEQGVFQRIRKATPYIIAALGYTILRSHALGIFAQGYGQPVTPASFALLPIKIASFIVDDGYAGLALGCLLVWMLADFLRTQVRYIFFLGAVFAGLMAPFYPIAYRLVQIDRAMILFSFVLCIAAVLLFRRMYLKLPNYRWLAVLSLIIFSRCTIQNSLAEREAVNNLGASFRAIGHFMLTADPDDIFLVPGQQFRAREASELRSLVYGSPGPVIVYDPLQLEQIFTPESSIFYFDESRKEIIAIGDDIDHFIEKWNKQTVIAPLDLSMKKVGDKVHWTFGPYRDNGYSVVLTDSNFAFARVFYSGIYTAPVPAMHFVLRYQFPDGSRTYSDTLRWESKEGEKLLWAR